jgi:hypothetical protein
MKIGAGIQAKLSLRRRNPKGCNDGISDVRVIVYTFFNCIICEDIRSKFIEN